MKLTVAASVIGNYPTDTHTSRQTKPALAWAAIGIVFGDIGTSPLYTMSTVFDKANGLTLNAGNLIGVISLIFWSLVVVVSLKYVILIMRANNHGEGGIMALVALAASAVADRPRLRHGLLTAGVLGAALFYGDGVITPAISVLSAVEGLKVAAPHLQAYVVPITLAVLVGLFLLQKHGTAGIGRVFGPIMVLWFVVMAIAGALNIVKAPNILAALNPLMGLDFLLQQGWIAFVSLGAVVLALTGAEALYADMGHFGAAPIRLSWFGLAFPALGLNYLGQGALLLADPKAIDSPFFNLFASWALYPMIFLATVATVIASQAVISGTYSMTKQAIQLEFLPRMRIVHTSESEIGQIYVPAINWILLAAVLAAVLGFGSSTALGSAYGIAVTGTMLITTFLTFFVVRYAWNYSWFICALVTGIFLAIDTAFFSANLLKFLQGGWFPLVIGAIIFLLMSTWKRGRELLAEKIHVRADIVPLKGYLNRLLETAPLWVMGTAVFLTADPDSVPHALISNLDHNQVLHERIFFVTVANQETPYVMPEQQLTYVMPEQQLTFEPLGWNCFRITVMYGFKDEVNLAKSLRLCNSKDFDVDPLNLSYFLSHASILATPGSGMWLWREKLFAAMSQNIGHLAVYLRLPTNRVIELGTQVEI